MILGQLIVNFPVIVYIYIYLFTYTDALLLMEEILHHLNVEKTL